MARVRPKPKRKPPLEAEITKEIRDYLNVKRIFHWKVFQSLGSTPGVPDILGCLPGGRLLAIEVKTEKGRLSINQDNFLKAFKRLGAKAFVARSVEDVIANGI